MRHPKREIEDFNRFRQVLTVLTEEGFLYLLDRLNVANHVPLGTKVLNRKRETRPERVRETIEKLGTTYIKFGQILAERPDLVPEEYTEELKKLQDSAPGFSPEKAVEIVEEEVGMENFESFSQDPLAAASIAQVHRATLGSGEEVIVKIRRPGVKEKVEKDLDIINFLAEEGEKHIGEMEKRDAFKFVKEFSRWTRQELDMKKESKNAQIFRENMDDLDKVKVPEVYPELTTEKVLVMEYVEGVKCTNKEELGRIGTDAEKIAKTAIRAGLKQSMLDGFFHADPHPSNFLISEEGEIVYLDFGMMGKISQKKSEKLGLALLYLIREDVDGILDELEDIGGKTENYERDSVEQIVEEKVLLIQNTTLAENSITKELFDMFSRLAEHGLHMPSSLTLMGKGLVTMEGIGLTIYPEFSLNEEYEKMIEEILREKNSPEKLGKDFAIDMIKNKDLFTKLPTKLNSKIGEDSGNMRVEIPETKINLSSSALIFSSAILMVASLFDRLFLYIAILELMYGIHLQKKN